MMAAGAVRKLDALGRVVIPKDLRDQYKLDPGDPVEFFESDEGILMVPYRPRIKCCKCCGKTENLTEVNGMRLCSECVEEFTKKIKK